MAVWLNYKKAETSTRPILNSDSENISNSPELHDFFKLHDILFHIASGLGLNPPAGGFFFDHKQVPLNQPVIITLPSVDMTNSVEKVVKLHIIQLSHTIKCLFS